MIRRFLVLLCAGCCLFAVACDDDETSPGTPITLEAIWPNENGRTWEFTSTRTTFKGFSLPDTSALYANREDVPPAPSIEDILPLIDHPPLPDSMTSETGDWALSFQDSITTQLGVTAQNLVEFPGGIPSPKGFRTAGERPSSLLAHVLRARPDLRERILGSSALAQPFDLIDLGPLFLHGGAWEKTANWIGTYGDLDTLLAWKYLEANLTPGHEFVHQVIPTSDVYLHTRVRRQVSVETPVGTFSNALEVVYLLDYGVIEATDTFGGPVGFYRPISYGNVLYVPTIGPVAVYERDLVSVTETLSLGVGDVSLDLIGLQAPLQVLTADR